MIGGDWPSQAGEAVAHLVGHGGRAAAHAEHGDHAGHGQCLGGGAEGLGPHQCAIGFEHVADVSQDAVGAGGRAIGAAIQKALADCGCLR